MFNWLRLAVLFTLAFLKNEINSGSKAFASFWRVVSTPLVGSFCAAPPLEDDGAPRHIPELLLKLEDAVLPPNTEGVPGMWKC